MILGSTSLAFSCLQSNNSQFLNLFTSANERIIKSSAPLKCLLPCLYSKSRWHASLHQTCDKLWCFWLILMWTVSLDPQWPLKCRGLSFTQNVISGAHCKTSVSRLWSMLGICLWLFQILQCLELACPSNSLNFWAFPYKLSLGPHI